MSDSAFFNVSLFSLFWALQIVASKLGFIDGAQIIPFTIQSTIVAIIVLSFYVLPRSFNELRKIPGKIILGILIANTIHFALGGFFSNAGIALTTAINAGFLVQFSTVTTSILAWTILKEKVTAPRVLMVALIMLGTFLLVTKGQLIIPHKGDLLILLACLAWSSGNILVKKVLKETEVSGDVVSFLRPIAGLPIFLLFVFFSPFYPVSIRGIFQASLWNISAGIYVILAGVFVALTWIFLNRTLKIATASYMTLMSSFTPVLVAILSIILLKESLAPIQAVGALLIITSTAVTHFVGVSRA